MPKVTAKYEAILIIDNNIGEEAVKAMVEKFSSLIAANGTVENTDEWGVRKFAYPINDLGEGYFTADPKFPAELDRVCNITDGVLRSLIISKE